MSDIQGNCALSDPQLNESTVEYRDIPGYPGYRVSKDGVVLSGWRQSGTGPGGGSVAYISNCLHPIAVFQHNDGYRYVMVKNENGKRVRRAVHRLVLITWTGPCPDGMEACHGDGIRQNNHISNLRWDTPKNNQADKKKHALLKIKEPGKYER